MIYYLNNCKFVIKIFTKYYICILEVISRGFKDFLKLTIFKLLIFSGKIKLKMNF